MYPNNDLSAWNIHSQPYPYGQQQNVVSGTPYPRNIHSFTGGTHAHTIPPFDPGAHYEHQVPSATACWPQGNPAHTSQISAQASSFGGGLNTVGYPSANQGPAPSQSQILPNTQFFPQGLGQSNTYGAAWNQPAYPSVHQQVPQNTYSGNQLAQNMYPLPSNSLEISKGPHLSSYAISDEASLYRRLQDDIVSIKARKPRIVCSISFDRTFEKERC